MRDAYVTGVQTCALPIFVSEELVDNTIYIGDGGDVVTISAQAERPRRPGQWMDPGALGSLGVGTGLAIEIGRASGRERVEISVVAGSLKKINRSSRSGPG